MHVVKDVWEVNSYTGLVEIQQVHPLGLTANVLFQNSMFWIM